MAEQKPSARAERAMKLMDVGYRAYVEQDFESMASLFAEDAVIHVSGSPDNPFTGDHKGVEGLRALFSMTKENQEEDRWDVEGFAASDDYAVALVKTSGTRLGRSESIPGVHVFRLNPEGKCNEAWYIISGADRATDDIYWTGMPLTFKPGDPAEQQTRTQW